MSSSRSVVAASETLQSVRSKQAFKVTIKILKGAFGVRIAVQKSLGNVEFIICLGSENRLKKSLHRNAVLLLLNSSCRNRTEHNLIKSDRT